MRRRIAPARATPPSRRSGCLTDIAGRSSWRCASKLHRGTDAPARHVRATSSVVVVAPVVAVLGVAASRIARVAAQLAQAPVPLVEVVVERDDLGYLAVHELQARVRHTKNVFHGFA
eukprot:8035038-Pyramimonas_sp.AAC.1